MKKRKLTLSDIGLPSYSVKEISPGNVEIRCEYGESYSKVDETYGYYCDRGKNYCPCYQNSKKLTDIMKIFLK